MKNVAHPEAVLRRAWNTHRLDMLRAIVDETIRTLHASDAGAVLGHDASGEAEDSAPDPVREALLTCCNELRDGCGLPLSTPSKPHELASAAQRPEDWLRRYDHALERYRDFAGAALQAALSERPGAGAL